MLFKNTVNFEKKYKFQVDWDTEDEGEDKPDGQGK